MCNIAGYVGDRPAAPILIDLLRRQEGLAGGYYTGIATIHEGKLYYRKVTGNLDRLLETTDAASLPGTVGIIHSRSKGKRWVGDQWAHPFVSPAQGDPTVAYVANGTAGIFAPRNAEYARITEELLREGYGMLSKVKTDSNQYLRLSDGTMVHISDVMCQLIRRNLDRGEDPVSAMSSAFCQRPGEIVGLMVTCDGPDAVYWSRINYPMYVSFAPHGAYLASTPQVFPDDGSEGQLLPACASGKVSKTEFSVRPYMQAPAKVARLDAAVRHGVYETVCKLLETGEKTCSDLRKAVDPLFTDGECAPATAAVYEALDALDRQGRLRVESRPVPGATDDFPATKFYLSLIR